MFGDHIVFQENNQEGGEHKQISNKEETKFNQIVEEVTNKQDNHNMLDLLNKGQELQLHLQQTQIETQQLEEVIQIQEQQMVEDQ